MKATHYKLGVRYAGKCLVCGRFTGEAEYEKARTSLYQLESGKFGAVHPECAGGKTKHAIGGGIKYRVEPAEEIEVRPS